MDEANDDFTIRVLREGAIADALDDLAALRIRVFREWPYLYDGAAGYERGYLERYARQAGSMVALVHAGDSVVGASTAAPLAGESAETLGAFEAAGFDPATVYYFGESVLDREWRGRGIGRRFMEWREREARGLGFRWCAFCAVERAADDPRRPADYRPLDPFWRSCGFEPREGLVGSFSWKEVGAEGESAKPMRFWLKRLGELRVAGSAK